MSRKPPPLADGEAIALAVPGGESVVVRIAVNPRARRIALRIDAARGEAIAIAPAPQWTRRAAAFAVERAAWIGAALSRLPKPQPFADGAVIPLQGKVCALKHERGRTPARLETDDGRLVLTAGGLDAAGFAARVQRFLQAQAEAALSERCAAHAQALGARYSRISVRDPKSRWGSCSADGALAFSWRVILAPPAVLDYLCAHEVAHLIEMNHSARFWALVARICPAHLAAREWLKRHGHELHVYGRCAPAAGR